LGDEGAHAEFAGHPQGLTVVAFGRLGVEGIATGSDLAQVAEGPSLVAALAALTGQREGSVAECDSLLEAIGQHIGLAQVRDDERLEGRCDPLLTFVKQGQGQALS
jgi:hypothetical protein